MYAELAHKILLEARQPEPEKPRSLTSEMGREAVMLGVGGAAEGAALSGYKLRRPLINKGLMNATVNGEKAIKLVGKRAGRDAVGAAIFGAGLGAAQHMYDVSDYHKKLNAWQANTPRRGYRQMGRGFR